MPLWLKHILTFNDRTSDKMESSRRRVYTKLAQKLRNGRVAYYGKVANVLLDCFLDDGGHLYSETLIKKGIVKDKEFTRWRDRMVAEGWLIWDEKQTDKSRYETGPKLSEYINTENGLTKRFVTADEIIPKEDIATKGEVEALRLELAEARAKTAEVEAMARGSKNVLSKLYDLFGLDEDPPGYEAILKHVKVD